MALDINQLIKFTNAGLSVARFTDIREALIARYKQTYGSDIDLSTGTADGVFVNDVAMLINNILQTISRTYSNLDVNQATGKYLDILCALSNVYRKGATFSQVSVTLENISGASLSLSAADLRIVDKSNSEWEPASSITLAPSDPTNVTFYCLTPGRILAPANWLKDFVNASTSSNVAFTQSSPAYPGQDEESDDSLKYRRTIRNALSSESTIKALVSKLLSVEGVDDVKVINNNTISSSAQSDGVTVAAHGVYIILRLALGTTIEDSKIGTIIYNAMTPGISTTDASSTTTGTDKSFNYQGTVAGVTVTSINQLVYWKEATPIAPQIKIKVVPQDYFNVTLLDDVATKLITYLNGLHIDEDISINNVLARTIDYDPMFRSLPTYLVDSVTCASPINNLTYFNYTTYSVDAGTGADIGKYIITLA